MAKPPKKAKPVRKAPANPKAADKQEEPADGQELSDEQLGNVSGGLMDSQSRASKPWIGGDADD